MIETEQIWLIESEDGPSEDGPIEPPFQDNGYFYASPICRHLSVWQVKTRWEPDPKSSEVSRLSEIHVDFLGSFDKGDVLFVHIKYMPGSMPGSPILSLVGETAEIWYSWLLQNGRISEDVDRDVREWMD